MASVLGVRNLSKSFGAIQALKDVSLRSRPARSAPSAARTAPARARWSRSSPASTSRTRHRGGWRTSAQAILNPRQAQELGIALVAQELSLCPDLSVEDNIWLGSIKVPFLHKQADAPRRARAALDLLGAGHIALDQPVGRLAIGERQLVEIARMLTREARVLILDEPTATLSDFEIDRIFAALLALKREGRSVIYITHRLGRSVPHLRQRQRLRNGELSATRRVSEHRPQGADRDDARPQLHRDVSRAAAGAGGTAALIVEDLCVPGSVERFSMSVPQAARSCASPARSARAPSRWFTRSPAWSTKRAAR